MIKCFDKTLVSESLGYFQHPGRQPSSLFKSVSSEFTCAQNTCVLISWGRRWSARLELRNVCVCGGGGDKGVPGCVWLCMGAHGWKLGVNSLRWNPEVTARKCWTANCPRTGWVCRWSGGSCKSGHWLRRRGVSDTAQQGNSLWSHNLGGQGRGWLHTPERL